MTTGTVVFSEKSKLAKGRFILARKAVKRWPFTVIAWRVEAHDHSTGCGAAELWACGRAVLIMESRTTNSDVMAWDGALGQLIDFDEAIAGAGVGGGESDGVGTGGEREDEGGIGAADGERERADT